MPKTRIATLGRERTIATLARKLYQIEGGQGTAELQRRAEAALLAANPRLSSAEGFRAGASVVVPTVAGIELTEIVLEASVESDGLIAEMGLRLQAAASRVEDAFAIASNRRKELSARVSDRRFVAEAKKNLPEAADPLGKTADRLRQEEAVAAETAKRLQSGLSKATEALKELEAVGRNLSRR